MPYMSVSNSTCEREKTVPDKSLKRDSKGRQVSSFQKWTEKPELADVWWPRSGWFDGRRSALPKIPEKKDVKISE